MRYLRCGVACRLAVGISANRPRSVTMNDMMKFILLCVAFALSNASFARSTASDISVSEQSQMAPVVWADDDKDKDKEDDKKKKK